MLSNISTQNLDSDAHAAQQHRDREDLHYRTTIAERNSPAIVLPRVRGMLMHKHRRKPNWVLAMTLYALGSTYASGICRDFGLDPDATV